MTITSLSFPYILYQLSKSIDILMCSYEFCSPGKHQTNVIMKFSYLENTVHTATRNIFSVYFNKYFINGKMQSKDVNLSTKITHSDSEFYRTCRSQWPRGLSHELSSLARTLGSWVRIPLKAWMSVCVYSVFVLSCV
jgi:hypothetical protein